MKKLVKAILMYELRSGRPRRRHALANSPGRSLISLEVMVDGHSLRAAASFGVDLLEDLVDVDRVRFLPLLAFLGSLSRGNSNRRVTHSMESTEYM